MQLMRIATDLKSVQPDDPTLTSEVTRQLQILKEPSSTSFETQQNDPSLKSRPVGIADR